MSRAARVYVRIAATHIVLLLVDISHFAILRNIFIAAYPGEAALAAPAHALGTVRRDSWGPGRSESADVALTVTRT